MNRHHTIVLFDAVGTVIRPNPGVVAVYHALGVKHGSRLDVAEIRDRISGSRRKHFNVGASAKSLFHRMQSEASQADSDVTPLADSNWLPSSDELECGLWKRLVFDVFAELETRQQLFDDLWEYFAQPQNWEVFPDVAACWGTLRNHGIEIGLASNFDSRLLRIVESIPTVADSDYVFCSSQVGFRKPSPLFYRQLELAIDCVSQRPEHSEGQGAVSDAVGSPRIVMVGDDHR